MAALLVLGCQPAVREDRTVTFGPDGGAALQHGHNGVFVTDPQTGRPKRIYEPVPGDFAFSPPAWDSAGRRMVFTVARPLKDTKLEPMGDAPADGRRYAGVPIRYTCWLYDPATPDGPEKLFEASAGHAGYVAAGLAVAWHPDGERLDYVEFAPPTRDRDNTVTLFPAPQHHQVRSFDLNTRQAGAAFMSGEHIVVGSSRRQPHRFVLVSGTGSESGLWIDSGRQWWRVESSEPESPHLETLRRRLPRWARDGTKLAFADGTSVRVCDIATRRTETWFRSEPPHTLSPFPTADLATSLHWHPDGTRIGLIDWDRLVTVGASGKVEALAGAGHVAVPVPPVAALVVDAIVNGLTGANNSVLAFAGWDASGRRMAYVATEPLPYRAGAVWATLFVPNPQARTAVRVADADGADQRTMIGGLRATFLHWSSTGSRLSVWLTVEPPYRLADGRVGMRPGDPAAMIDVDTGKLEWLPVNGTEHAQIGHVELRAGRLDAALRRFDDAVAALPAEGKADWMLFRAVALQKAGRGDDARAAWARFEPPPARDRAGGQAPDRLLRAADPQWPLIEADAVRPRHRFAAEAFVSLEMIDDGIEFLRRELRDAGSDAERLSAAVALCQMLLLADRKGEYAECVADHLLPLAGRVFATPPPNPGATQAVAWTLMPLAVGEFTAALSEETVRRVGASVAAWTGAGTEADLTRQLVLRACGRRLKDGAAVASANERLANHPSQAWKPAEGREVDAELLLQFRIAFLLQERIVEEFLSGTVPAR
jgi:hypothetical protein